MTTPRNFELPAPAPARAPVRSAPAAPAPSPPASRPRGRRPPPSWGARAAEARRAARDGVLLALGACGLYLATLAPTLTWGDSADLARRAFDLRDALMREPERDYWLFRLLAQPFVHLPFGDVAWRVNAMTALFGALAVAAIHRIVWRRTRRRDAALVAGAALAVSHSFWLLSVMTEVYTLAIALQAWALAGLLAWSQRGRRRDLVLASLAAGLALAHHPTAWLFAPGAGLLLLRERWRLRPGDVAAALAALLPGVFLLVAHALLRPHPGGFAVAWLGPRELPRAAVMAAAYLAYQFPGAGLLLAAAGAAYFVVRRRTAWDDALLLSLVLLALWAVAMRVPDKFNAYVLVYPWIAVLLGIGFAAWRAGRVFRVPAALRSRAASLLVALSLVLAPPLVYAAAPILSRLAHVDLVRARPCAYRDNDRYFLQPWKNGDPGARRYAEAALRAASPDAILVADYTLYQPLAYLQRIEHARADVSLVMADELVVGEGVDAYLERHVDAHPVYLAASAPPAYYQLDRVLTRFALEEHAPVFLVHRQ